MAVLETDSVKCGETLLIANGFSCRAQIEELAGRTPLHLAEVLSMACPA